MDIQVYNRTDLMFINEYINECNHIDMTNLSLVHITLTLNPLLNNADMLTQYRSMINEIKKSNVFAYKVGKQSTWTVHNGFHKLLLVAELTKTINIHLHGILICDKSDTAYFMNEFRRMTWNSQVLGRQHSFNIVNDAEKDRSRVAQYAFKDCAVLNKFPDSKKIYNIKFQKII